MNSFSNTKDAQLLINCLALFLLLYIPPRCAACSQAVAGKLASAIGGTLLSYSNDFDEGTHNLEVVSVPAKSSTQARMTFPAACAEIFDEDFDDSSRGFTLPYLRIQVFLDTHGTTPEGGINAAGLAATFGAFNYPLSAVAAADPFVASGVGHSLWNLVLERCETPECAVDLVARLTDVCGLASGAAGSFVAANATDAWLIEVLSGHHWIAARIPQSSLLLQPNVLRIGREFNLSKLAWFRASSGLLDFAARIDNTLQQKSFNPATAFGGNHVDNAKLWRMFALLAPEQTTHRGLKPTTPLAEWPTFVSPTTPITIATMQRMHRDHFEGMPGVGHSYAEMNPHANAVAPLCRGFTTYNALFVLRTQPLPSYVLMSPASPCISAPVPFFVGASDIPDTWRSDRVGDKNKELVFETFRALQSTLDSPNNGGLHYGKHIDEIHAMRTKYEARLVDALASVDAVSQHNGGNNGIQQLQALEHHITFSLARELHVLGKQMLRHVIATL